MGVYFDIISVAFNTDSESGVREIATRLQVKIHLQPRDTFRYSEYSIDIKMN